jgi:hypothetical protein
MKIETSPDGEQYVVALGEDGTAAVARADSTGERGPGERGKSLERWIEKRVDLNEDQRRKFADLQRDFAARMKEFQKQLADFEDQHRAALQGLLTPDQRDELDASRRQPPRPLPEPEPVPPRGEN